MPKRFRMSGLCEKGVTSPPVSAPTGSPASLQLVVLVDICDGDTDGVPATEADRGTQVRTRLAAGRWREADSTPRSPVKKKPIYVVPKKELCSAWRRASETATSGQV